MDVIGNKSAHFRDCGDVSLLTFPHDGSQSDGFSQEQGPAPQDPEELVQTAGS